VVKNYTVNSKYFLEYISFCQNSSNMANKRDEVSSDQNAKNFSIFGPYPRKRSLVQSKAESSRNTIPVDNSARILLSVIKPDTIVDDAAPQECPEHTSIGCNCTSRGANPCASSHLLVPWASTFQVSVPLISDRPLQQDVQAPVFYGREMKHMRIFSREVDEAVHVRFREVHEQLEPASLNFMSKERIAYRSTAIRLMVLGTIEEEAKPWVVIHCPHSARKKTRKFLKKDLIISMCQGSPSCQIKFDSAVCSSLEKADSEDLDEVFIEEDDSETFKAWTPQIKVVQSDIARYATMGGFVFVTVADEKKSVYGMTAGHVLPTEELYDRDVCISSEEDSEDDESDDDSDSSSLDPNPVCYSSNAGSPTTPQHSFASDEEVPNDELHRSWASLGHMSRASYSTGAQDHDWALIELTTSQTERLKVSKALLGAPLHAARPAGDHRALVWNRSMTECTISSLPARAILPSGRRFVDVDVLYPDKNEGI
jgi:hypothetical protein